MKKSVTKIMKATIAFALAVGASVGAITSNKTLTPLRADENVTLAYNTATTTNMDGTNQAALLGLSATDWSVVGAKGSASYNVGLNKAKNIRLYYHEDGGNTLTIASLRSWTITTISITYVSEDYNNATVTPGTGSNSGTTGSWTINSSSFVVGNGNTSSVQVQIKSIAINYSTGGGGSSSSSDSSSSSEPAPTTYLVTYNANGGTGSVPEDNTAYSSNASVTVLGNTGNITKSGKIWSGWNTLANGTGTTYKAGDSFAISNNTTLYARWIDDYSSAANVSITAPYLNLPAYASAYTEEKIVHADDGMEYVISPSADNKVYAITSDGSNSFDNSTLSKVFIGKSGAYLYNKDPFPRSIEKVEVYAATGCSKSVAVAVALGTTVQNTPYTTSPTTLNTQNHVFTVKDQQGANNFTYFRLQVTNANNANIQIRITFYNPTTSVTVTPESVTLAPNETQQLTTTVTPADTTDSLTYGSSDDAVASVDSDGLITAHAAGTATITATSGSYSDTCAVTVELPVVPFITPEKSSTSGFTGESESIGFSYGNLTNLNVSTQNGKVSASIENDNDAGDAEVEISFISAGSSEVYLKDGSTTLATITVEVTLSSVSISGLPASEAIDVAEELNLGSAITINSTGSCSDEVTWESDDESVATVDTNGLVTGVSYGVTSITVSSFDYPSATMTCEVTVSKKDTIDLSAGYEIDKPAAVQDQLSSVLIGNYTMNTLNVHNNANATPYEYVMFATKQFSTTNSLLSNKTPTPGPITRIVFTTTNGIAAGAVLNATLSSSEVTTTVTDDTHTLTGKGSIVITADSASNLRYFAISCTSSGSNAQLVSIKVFYDELTPTQSVNELNTRSVLAYKYTTEPLAITAAAIRFGGLISKATWDKIDDSSTIQGYGILLSTAEFLNGDQLKDKYNAVDGTNVKKFDHAVATLPDEANTSQTKGLLEDHYVWNLFKNVPLDKLTVEYVAVAYIRTASGVMFLNEASASVCGLADDMLATDEYDNDSYGGSLKYLADLN